MSTDVYENGENTPDVQISETDINRCLLPVLRCVASLTAPETDEAEREQARHVAQEDIGRELDVYRGLARAWREGSVEQRQSDFASLSCSQKLLGEAFAFISAQLARIEEDTHRQREEQNRAPSGGGRELLFISLFRITEEGEAVDLSYPFEQYYFCDSVLYRDYLFRRTELGDKCKAWLRHYRPYYNRIETSFRAERQNPDFALPVEYNAYMELIDFFTKQILYEDGLREKREALEYERGGLGWFHFARKRAIRAELLELDAAEVRLRLDSARERCEAYADQFRSDREKWSNELGHAPRTAFARRRELKARIAEVEEKLAAYCQSQRLEELEKEYRRLSGYEK